MTPLPAGIEGPSLSGPALFAAVLLAAILAHSLWRAWQRLGRVSRARWLLVGLLNVGAAGALFLMLAPPSLPVHGERGVALLTDGATPEQATDYPLPYVLPKSSGVAARASLLLHPGQLLLREPALTELRLAGYGLDESAWRDVPGDVRVDFQPPPLEGLVDASWPRRVTVGEAVAISGTIRSPSDKVLTLELLDPAGNAAGERALRSGDRWSFTTRPRAAGLLEYRLRLRLGEAVAAEEPVRLEAVTPRAPRIRYLQSAPGFEARHLRQWAGDRDARVIVDSPVSLERRIARGVNLEGADTLGAPLTEAALATDDLLIVDGRRWASLDRAERSAMERAVRGGLGLLVLADADLARHLEQRQDLLLSPLGLAEEPRAPEPLVPSLPGVDSDLALPVGPWRLAPGTDHVLLRDRNGRTLEAWREVGLGRVALSVLRERHRWITAGEAGSYSAYWGRLLRIIGRPEDPPYLLPPDPAELARPDRLHAVCLLAGDDAVTLTVEAAGVAPQPLAPVPSALGGPRRCAWFWPTTPGWLRFALRSETGDLIQLRHEYVHAADEWLALERERRALASTARAAAPAETAAPGSPPTAPLAPLWPWLLLLACAIPLWVERRLADGA